MTPTELTNRLREAIVLNGPDVWRTNGYLQDAQEAGLSLPDALKQANDISQEVSNNNLLFENIRARIARMAQPSRSHLIEQDLAQIINAASSLKLSPDFVRNQWIPAVLQQVTPAPAPRPAPTPEPTPPTPPAAPTALTPPSPPASAFDELLSSEPPKTEPTVLTPPTAPTPPIPYEPVVLGLSETSKPPVLPPVVEKPVSQPEPAPIVRSFTATPARVRQGQTVTLEWEVENLLAVTIDDLGEGLSPKNRGWVRPTKSTDYTLFDAENNPLSTVQVEVIPRDRSGIYGVLFALVLLAIIYWFIRSSNARKPEPRQEPKTEQTTDLPTTEPDRPAVNQQDTDPHPMASQASDTIATDKPNLASRESFRSETPATHQDNSTQETPAPALQEPQPTTPADARTGKYIEAFGDKPYDKVEVNSDEQGWHRARKKGRWGYIDEAGEWMIKPEYEAVTPFRGNTATVFLNGQLITINRQGEQVRN